MERLRARVEAAAAAAARDLPGSGELDLEDLERRAVAHKLGTNAFGWSNPYPPDDPRNLLFQYQFASWHDPARFILELWSRRAGKDFTSEGVAVEDCYKITRNEWMIAAPSERQALDSLDIAKDWVEAFSLKIHDYREAREGASSNTLLKSAEITLSNKSKLRAVPGKPDTVRGRGCNLLLTEFDFFENPAATWRALLPSIANPLRGGQKKVRLITTPNGKAGATHKLWTKPDGARMRWSRRLVTIYHAVLMGLPVDVAELREAFDDPEGWLQEFCCQFLDQASVLLPYDLIALAESAAATEAWALSEAGLSHPVFAGIDFGRSGDPTVCWTLQAEGDALWTREVLVLDNVSSPDQEQILRDRIRAASRVCYDYTGPGIGLGDYLVKEHGRWHPEGHEFGRVELCTFTAAFKRLIFPRLRKAFEPPTRLRIPISTAIREDLHEVQQVIANGDYNYWSPRTRKGHSDRCTALALAVRAADAGLGGAFTEELIRGCLVGSPRGKTIPRHLIPAGAFR